ncbi:MAG: ATP synthase subunit I [Acidobacteria bacterium]|nr:ATP synthase subunit I [Acidobacteriota bacterium]
MTEELGPWSLAIGGGAAVAVLYLTSLWWTVARVARTRHPARLVAVSYLLRAPIAALALFAVAAGDAPRLLAALASFLAVRTVVVRSVRSGGYSASTR